MTCSLFLFDCLMAFREGQRYWVEGAVANIRVGLDGFTSTPSLWPWRTATTKRQRLFPTKSEYTERMRYDDQQVPDMHVIAEWQTENGVR